MEFTNLAFSKDWKNPDDFKTVETDEEQVRADYQFLHDETRDYINTVLLPTISALYSTTATVVQQTLTPDKWDEETLTQSVVAAGIIDDESKQLIQIVPSSASQANWLRFGAKCASQGADTLVYSAETRPDVTLVAYAVVSEVAL